MTNVASRQRLTHEPDGDIDIQLKPDKQFLSHLNPRNKSAQRGNLVLEPICVNTPTQAHAIQPCKALTNQVSIPNVGAHVAVTGSYVHDIQAGHGWMEIDPMALIESN